MWPAARRLWARHAVVAQGLGDPRRRVHQAVRAFQIDPRDLDDAVANCSTTSAVRSLVPAQQALARPPIGAFATSIDQPRSADAVRCDI